MSPLRSLLKAAIIFFSEETNDQPELNFLKIYFPGQSAFRHQHYRSSKKIIAIVDIARRFAPGVTNNQKNNKINIENFRVMANVHNLVPCELLK